VTAVKCVVWDLDGTVWPGVAIEAANDDPPRPFPEALRAMSLLEQRGIVNSVASRTDPVLGELVRTHPDLAGRFVAPQVSWGHKSDAIAAIADELGVATTAIAFVDDNPFERAEVAAVLPGVLVLAPEELYDRLDTPQFRPALVTADARRRPDRYREAERREAAARDFSGTREEFLRASDIRLTLGRAGPADADRVVELIDRTHRFNTTGQRWEPARVRAAIDDPDWFVSVAHLVDRFGDYGMVGTALIERGPAWLLRVFAVSCRAAGRDVPVAILDWIIRTARQAGSGQVLVELRPSEANLELRVLLRAAGFQPVDPAAQAPAGDGLLLTRSTTDDLPPVPWLTVTERADHR